MSDTAAAPSAHLKAAFATEERRALRLLMIARVCVTAAIVVFLLLQFPDASGVYWSGLTALFGLLGIVIYAVNRSRFARPWQRYLFIAIDLAIVTFIILYPNPFASELFPIQQRLKYPNFDYLYLVVSLTALTYAPALAAWAGIAAVLSWGTACVLVLLLPETISALTLPSLSAMTIPQRSELWTLSKYVDIGALIQQGFIMLCIAAVLATAAWRARRLVSRQVRTERARANLSRYFSPGLIEELADQDEPLGAVREQNVAVLFADIVGFTTLSENQPPEKVIALLRTFHARMAREVFAHGGTVDKYIGDAIMATFGTPRTGVHDATNALACARAMLASVDAWNRERVGRGEAAIEVGIGLHFGPAVMGDIGDERRLEYAVIGDTVNVAARLEGLTREIEAPLVVSDDTVAAVRRETGETAALTGLQRGRTATVRGRAGAVPVWTLHTAPAGAA